MTRKPKNQARAADKTIARSERIAQHLEDQELIEDLDRGEIKASNVVLPSETTKRPSLTLKKEKIPLVRPGSKAPEKPTEAPTAEEAKAATPVAKKTKAAPKTATAPVWKAPQGSTVIMSKEETPQPIGYVQLTGQVYGAFTKEGDRLAIGLTAEKTEANFRGKYAAHQRSK